METIQRIPMDVIFHGDNVRLLNPERLDIPGLWNSIDLQNGLTDPITVHEASGRFEVVKGNRRLYALMYGVENHSLRFNELFKSGIPAIVLSGMTPEQVQLAKVDQGNQMTLSHPFELVKAYSFIIAENPARTEKEIITLLHGVLSVMHAIKGKRLEVITKYRDEISEHRQTGTLSKVANLQSKIEDEQQKFWHGKLQTIKRICDTPHCVYQTLWTHAEGEKHPDLDVEFPSVLRNEDVTTLHAAHVEDQKQEEPRYTRSNPGPAFKAAWQEILTNDQDEKPEKIRSKAKSAKALKEEAKKWESEGFNKLTRSHAGEEMSGLGRLDKLYAEADAVASQFPKEFDELVKKAKAKKTKVATK